MSPGFWFNVSLIDFWMKWITRMELQPVSYIHTFTTHIYPRLEDEGIDSVLSWTANWGIDVQSQKIIYVPTHKDKHWPLMVLANTGLKDHFDELDTSSGCPCILRLDGEG